MGVLYAIGAIASAVAAVLAWTAKILWAREYAAAKDEIIRAKEAQIGAVEAQLENLRELTPMKIREYFVSVKQQLEEYIDLLKQDLESARGRIAAMSAEIERLRAEGGKKEEELAELERQRDDARGAAEAMEKRITELQSRYQSKRVVTVPIPALDPELVARVNEASRKMAETFNRARQYHASPEWASVAYQVGETIERAARALAAPSPPAPEPTAAGEKFDDA